MPTDPRKIRCRSGTRPACHAPSRVKHRTVTALRSNLSDLICTPCVVNSGLLATVKMQNSILYLIGLSTFYCQAFKDNGAPDRTGAPCLLERTDKVYLTALR